LPHTSYEDISEEALDEYYRLRAMVNSKASKLKLDKKQLLLSLGLGVKNKEGVVTPTIAGLALFGKREAIKRVMPAWRVDYIVVEGTKWESNSSERYKFAIEYYEPLIILMLRLHTEVMGDLPMKFELKPDCIQRNDIPLIPREVIRESIANMLMHRDYRMTFLSQVVRYSNRIEFKNGGYSLKSLDQLLNDSGSMLRNPAIAKVFHDLKFAEGKGTGISSMRDNLKEAGFTTPPIFETDRSYNRFDLILFPHHLLDENTINWLSYFKQYNLTDADRRALAFVKNVGAISNADYRQLNGVDTLNASRGLARLKELSFIQMKGSGSNTFYVLSKEVTPQVTPKYGELAPHTNPLYKGFTPQVSLKHEGLTLQVNSKPGGIAAIPAEFPKLPEDIIFDLLSLGKKKSIEKIRKLIRRLCALGPLKLSQISMIFGRSPRYLRDTFLTEMIKS